jgi:hypothetical protein
MEIDAPDLIIEIRLSDHLNTIEIDETDSDLIEGVVSANDTSDLLSLMEESDICAWVEEQDAEEMSGYFTSDFLQKMYDAQPELVRLALAHEPITIGLHDLSIEIVSQVSLSRGDLRTEFIVELTQALDVLVKSPGTRDLIHAALYRYMRLGEEGSSDAIR